MTGVTTGVTTGAIVGRRIQRVDQPHAHFICLELSKERGGDKEYLLLAATAASHTLGLSPTRVRGEIATPFTTKLRHHLKNQRITAVHESRQALTIVTSAAGLAVESRPTSLILFGADGRVLASMGGRVRAGSPYELPSQSTAPLEQALRENGPEMWQRHLKESEGVERREIRQLLTRRRKQLSRRLKAITSDLEREAQAPKMRHEAQLLLAHLRNALPGSRTLAVEDWAFEPPKQRSIDLEPGHTPASQAEAWFHKAGRFERGALIARERVIETETALAKVARLRQLEKDTAGTALPDELVQLRAQSSHQTRSAKHGPAVRLPYKTFTSVDGGTLLLGRSARDNDVLTFKVARPMDLWLHARGTRGAHVIVRLRKGENCPPERLLDAVALAAHFSEARGESPVEVQYTLRRNVRKPKGLPPGAVLVSQEKVILFREDRGRIARLLA